jgi:hypothetical protein
MRDFLSFLDIRNKRTGKKKQLRIIFTAKRMQLVLDEATGQAYQCVDTSGYTHSENRGLGFGCQSLCEQELFRPHTTCVGFCAIRRVLKGEIPSIVPVHPYMLLRLHNKYRHHVSIKDLLAKKLLVIVEWLVST